MTMPESTKSWRKLCEPTSSSTAIGIELLEATILAGRSVVGRGNGIIDFNGRAGLERANGFVAAGDDQIPFMQAAGNFDIGDAGDASLHGHEFGFAVAQNEDSLNVGFHAGRAFAIRGRQRDTAAVAIFRLVEFFL